MALDAALMMKRMIHRFAFVTAVTLLCMGCTSTDIQSPEGRNSGVVGDGATRKVVDGASYPTTKRRAAYIVYRHWGELAVASEEAKRVLGRDESKWTKEEFSRFFKATLGLCAAYNEEEFPGQPWSVQMADDCVYFLGKSRKAARAYLISQVLM
jgi:hypothetical protein